MSAEYDYVDANGVLQFQVCRLEPKAFRQRRPDGNGGFIWNIVGIKPILYRLPEVLEAVSLDRLILVVEGEKDCDRLWPLGVPATCNSGGANKWKPEHSEPLAGADVVVIPDNDRAGQDHAQAVAHALKGHSGRVRLLDLKATWAEAPEKGDISDWLNTGKTAEDLYEIIERLPDWTPSVPPSEALPLVPPTPAPRPYPLSALGETLSGAAANIAAKCRVPRHWRRKACWRLGRWRLSGWPTCGCRSSKHAR